MNDGLASKRVKEARAAIYCLALEVPIAVHIDIKKKLFPIIDAHEALVEVAELIQGNCDGKIHGSYRCKASAALALCGAGRGSDEDRKHKRA